LDRIASLARTATRTSTEPRSVSRMENATKEKCEGAYFLLPRTLVRLGLEVWQAARGSYLVEWMSTFVVAALRTLWWVMVVAKRRFPVFQTGPGVGFKLVHFLRLLSGQRSIGPILPRGISPGRILRAAPIFNVQPAFDVQSHHRYITLTVVKSQA
jgi:hypothetical protein